MNNRRLVVVEDDRHYFFKCPLIVLEKMIIKLKVVK